MGSYIVIQPGMYSELPNEQYHKDSAISRSGMMLFAQSPYKYWAEYINPHRPEKKSTAEMEFGTAFHTFILEYDLFAKSYCVAPILEKLPKKLLLKNVGRPAFEANKAERSKLEFINGKTQEDFEDQAEDKIILSAKSYDLLLAMRDALYNHPEAWGLIEGAAYEQSYFWKDKESGLMVKSRPDILHSNMIVDLKTIADASSRCYQRDMTSRWYHVQGAIIRDGIRELTGKDIPNVINVCIEKTYPYSIGIKIISEAALEEGQRKYKSILVEMKSAFENNYFPDYEIETVELPMWYS